MANAPPGEPPATRPALSFAVLEARLQAMPDGPVARLDQPRWARICGWLTMGCILLGLLPILLVRWMTPQQWMLWMARFGVWGAYGFSAPFIARVAWILLTEMTGWTRHLVAQSDHDREAFAELREWLSGFPRDALEDHRRYAALAAARLTAKLPLLVGAVERLGALPLLVALFLLAMGTDQLTLNALADIRAWKAVIGIALVLSYAIGIQAVRMRLRLELYEIVLAAAVAQVDQGLPPRAHTAIEAVDVPERVSGSRGPCGLAPAEDGLRPG